MEQMEVSADRWGADSRPPQPQSSAHRSSVAPRSGEMAGFVFPALDSISEKTGVWETRPAPAEEFG